MQETMRRFIKQEQLFVESEKHVVDYFRMMFMNVDAETLHSVKTSLFQGTCEDMDLLIYVEDKVNTTFPLGDIQYKQAQEWTLFYEGCIMKHYWYYVVQKPHMWDHRVFTKMVSEQVL